MEEVIELEALVKAKNSDIEALLTIFSSMIKVIEPSSQEHYIN